MDPLLYIERGLEYHSRKNWGRLIFVWSLLFLSLAIMSLILQLPEIYIVSFEILFLIFLTVYIANGLAKVYFLNQYKNRILSHKGKTYEVLKSEEKARLHKDDVLGFLNSKYGDETMKRLGLTRLSVEDYIEKRKFRDRVNDLDTNEKIDLQIHALNIYDQDEHFASYLRSQRIQRNDLLHAARIVQNHSALAMEQDRVWSKEPLHDLSAFELDAMRLERAHDIYFTSPVLMKLAVLDEEEKFDILRNIIPNAKSNNQRVILISDLAFTGN